MGEVNVGEIRARLTADTSEFVRNIQAATAALAQFQQQVQTQAGQVTQGMQRAAQGTQVLQQQLTLLNQQAISQTGFLGQMTRQLDEMRVALEQTRQTSQQVGSTWQTLFQVAGGIGLATSIQEIVRAIARFTTESVRLAASMQDLRRSFVALEGSGDAANRTLNFLFETAQRTGTSFQTLAEGYRRLEAGAQGTTLSSQELQRALEGIAAGARVMGLSTQQSQSALVAWEQILTKGRLAAEELVRQLGNAVPGGLARVASGLNVTTQELRAMAEAGLIPGTVAFVAFGEEMRKLGAGGGALDGLTKTFENFTNELTAWQTAIGNLISTAIQPWIDKINELSKALRDLMGIRPPGQAAPGTGPATPEGPATSRTQFPLAPSPYTALIQQEARRSAIDPGLLSQLVRVESGFNPTAESRAGALGLGQLLLPTAQGLEMGVTRETLLEPERNLRLAAKYLADQLDTFRQFDDQVKLALAAYNAGPGTVENLLNAARREGRPRTYAEIAPQLPQETQRYVGRVLDFPAMQAAAAPAVAAQAAEAQEQKVTALRKQVEDLLQMLPRLQQQVDAIQQSGGNVGQILDREVARGAESVVRRVADMQQTFATLPRLAEQLPASLRAQFDEATKQVAIWQQLLLTDTQRRDLLKQQVEQMEQLTLRQQAQLLRQQQGQEEAERFARTRTQELQEARLAERPRLAGLTVQQQIANYRTRLEALSAEATRVGLEVEADQEARQRRREASQNLDIFGLMLSPEQEAELKQQAKEQRDRIQEFAKSLDIFGLELSPEQERQRRASTAFDQRLQAAYEQLMAPREERPERRLRAEAARAGVTLTEDQEAMLRRMTQIRREQEQLNEVLRVYDQFANSIGSAWTNTLTSIADGTKTVGEAFRDMARSIMQSLAQIASQEAFRALIRIGAGLITSAFLGGGGASVGGGEAALGGGTTSGSGFLFNPNATGPVRAFQHGGVVTRPTMALLGENGPEAVLNRQQMSTLMSSAIRSAPSAGGQAAGGISIHNHPSRDAAEQAASRDRALGKTAIVNEVLSDLSQGEASKIGRMLRTIQR